MTINRYRANSLKSAIDKATAEMGPDAKILNVRKLDSHASGDGSYSKPKKSEIIEIIAVVDDDLEMSNEKGGSKIFDDANKKGKSHSVNMIVNDDIAASDLTDFSDVEENLPKKSIRKNNVHIPEPDNSQSKKPTPLSEALKTYSGKAYPERRNAEIDKSQTERNPEQRKDRRNSNIYTDNSKNSLPIIEESPKAQKNDFDWEALSQSRSNTPKSRISQMLHECLVKNQVNSDLTYEILSILNDNESSVFQDGRDLGVRDYLLEFLSNNLSISNEAGNSPKVAVLIGPTGVGKTTTVAKLAAQYHFKKERNVGLITIDAYRIAAVEQLKTYAQIMSIPLKVALTPEQLWKCIDDYGDMDVILVDTPGRSHLNMREVRAIEEFLEAAQPADTHLLISASTKDNDAHTVLETFAPDYVQKYIFTKLDETSSFGVILNLCSKLKKPISYFTMGQNVPDDIRMADLEYLADLFVSRRRFIR